VRPDYFFTTPQYPRLWFVYTGMDTSFSLAPPYEKTLPMAEQNRRLTETVVRESGRLGSFIRQRVPDPGEAEDILQDVFFELVEAWRLPEPIEQVGAWLFRVARNRIIDRFRKRREEPMPSAGPDENDEATHWLENALPAGDGGPEAAHLRRLWLDAITTALDELPPGPCDTFIAHELDGRSFKEMAAESGVPLNTLLGWKRQAVLHLRDRLRPLYDEQS
jgi:RNA polymerase sigma factor (sigma-70 family)